MQSILRLSIIVLLALFAIVATLLTSWLDARETGETASETDASTCRGVLKLGSIKLRIAMEVSPAMQGGFRAAIVKRSRLRR
jgi:hypothetical protein